MEIFENNIPTIITSLSHDELDKILHYIKNWNTDIRHSIISQLLFHEILKTIHPSSLLEFKNIKEILQGMIPYTERHFNRIEKLYRQSFFT